jgi:hypothetical protein
MARGMDFHIRSSTPTSAFLSGFVCPNDFPNEHSPMLYGHMSVHSPSYKSLCGLTYQEQHCEYPP